MGDAFRRVLPQLEDVWYGDLLSLLSMFFVYKEDNDTRIWKPTTVRKFLAKALDLEGTTQSSSPYVLLWVGLTPP